MKPEFPSTARITFALFEVNLRTREVFRAGIRMRLGERPLQVLEALLERPGEVVTRDELRQRLWGQDTFVDFEHGLNTAVKKLRQMLGDEADSPRYIETVPRRGYRFIAAVEPVARDGAPRDRPSNPGSLPNPDANSALVRNPSPAKKVGALGWLAFLVAAGLLATGFLAARRLREPALAPARTHAKPARIESVTVLPFRDISGDPTGGLGAEDLSRAVFEQLEVGGTVRVIPHRAAIRQRELAELEPEGGRRFDADAVLDGEVVAFGDKARVTVRLADARDGSILWSGSYMRPLREMPLYQAKMVRLIAEDVEKALGGKAVAMPARSRRR